MFFSYSTFFFLIWILTCDSYYLSTVMLLLAAIKSKLRSIWTMIELGQDRVWTESIVETVTGIKLEEEDSIDWVEGLLCATSEWSNFRPWTAIQTLSRNSVYMKLDRYKSFHFPSKSSFIFWVVDDFSLNCRDSTLLDLTGKGNSSECWRSIGRSPRS